MPLGTFELVKVKLYAATSTWSLWLVGRQIQARRSVTTDAHTEMKLAFILQMDNL